ncbi:MAG: hypothetical protein NTY53_20510 [Kiritimatiellaeota bacterium]|nr:hypothetical protein [Kiritimatiellota bacterium]
MKKLTMVVLGICAVTLLTPATFAKGKKGGDAPATVPSDVYAKYDANHNGLLDDVEKAAIRKDFAADANDPLLKPLDTNNDGKLSDEEIAAIPATKAADAPAKKKKKKNQ